MRSPAPRILLASLFVLAVLVPLFVHFHDRSWIPSDDGQYAHVAERVLDGEVLHRDTEEFHAAPVHLIHALALQVWGRDLVSLRYPIAILAISQALLVLLCFSAGRRPLYVGVVAALSVALIGPLQIADPTPNLYALFTAIAICTVMIRLRPSGRQQVLVGALLAVTFYFRQITGIFAAMAVLTTMLSDTAGRARGDARAVPDESRWLSGLIHLVMLLGLLGYLATATDPGGWVLFGFGPLGLLLIGTADSWRPSGGRRSASNPEALRIIGMLAIGFVAVSAALGAYYLHTGALTDFFRDVFVSAPQITRLGHLHRFSYLFYLFGDGSDLGPVSPLGLANRLYWWMIVLVAAVQGVALLWVFGRGRDRAERALILPVMATFHAQVALYNQIHFYLYVTAGLSLAAMLWFAHRHMRGTLAALAAFCCVIGVYSHAGQSYRRSFKQTLLGERASQQRSDLDRSGLWMDPDELDTYRQVVSILRATTATGTPIFALPNNAEIYFLADRPNPFRLFNTTISSRGADMNQAFLKEFDRVAPAWVVHDTEQHYNTADTELLMAHIRDRYELHLQIRRFALYRPRAAGR